MGVQWEILGARIDLTLVNIDVSATEQQNYQWGIQSEHINNIGKIIETYPYAINTLGRALSVILENAMLIPTSLAILME